VAGGSPSQAEKQGTGDCDEALLRVFNAFASETPGDFYAIMVNVLILLVCAQLDVSPAPVAGSEEAGRLLNDDAFARLARASNLSELGTGVLDYQLDDIFYQAADQNTGCMCAAQMYAALLKIAGAAAVAVEEVHSCVAAAPLPALEAAELPAVEAPLHDIGMAEEAPAADASEEFMLACAEPTVAEADAQVCGAPEPKAEDAAPGMEGSGEDGPAQEEDGATPKASLAAGLDAMQLGD
jgi:hypothetical protein